MATALRSLGRANVLTTPGLEDNDLPVQIYRTNIYDETGKLWRQYDQTIARSSDASVYLLQYEETFLDQERPSSLQPRLMYPSRDEAVEGFVFTDGLGYRWRVRGGWRCEPKRLC